jgi:hypothetical protein
MTELKTLKDLTEQWSAPAIDLFEDELKAEAVKWVKFCRIRKSEFGYNLGDKLPMGEGDFVDFFNLTEEDLK